MASLNHLIGWDWHLPSRVPSRRCQRGDTAALRWRRKERAVFPLLLLFFFCLGKRKLSVTHTRQSQTHICSYVSANGRRGGRRRGARRIEINERDQSGPHVFSLRRRLRTFVTVNFTQMSRGPLIKWNRYLSAPDSSAASFSNYNPAIWRWEAEKWRRLRYCNQTDEHEILQDDIVHRRVKGTDPPHSVDGSARETQRKDEDPLNKNTTADGDSEELLVTKRYIFKWAKKTNWH